MNDLTITTDTLPTLIDRAAQALTSARTSAEVLEARDMARVAYDAAKSVGRMAKAKAAHDDVIAAVYRAQAHAAVIEARAKVRLADEYDEAQKRGEVAGLGANQHREEGVVDANTLGLRRDEIHEARKLRDAEAAEPGKIEAAADALVARGEEPTKAALRREVIGEASPEPAPPPRPDPYGYAKLTEAALLDLADGLRADLDDANKRIRKQTHDIAGLKMQIKNHTDDKDEVIRRLSKEAKDAKAAKFRAEEDLTAWKRQVHGLKKDVARLEKSLASQEITL